MSKSVKYLMEEIHAIVLRPISWFYPVFSPKIWIQSRQKRWKCTFKFGKGLGGRTKQTIGNTGRNAVIRSTCIGLWRGTHFHWDENILPTKINCMCCNTKLAMRLRAKHRSCMPQNSQVNRTGEKTKSWRSLGRMLSKSHRRQQWQCLLHYEFFSCSCSCGTLTLTLFFWEEFATTMEGGMAGGWWLFAHFSCPTGMPAQGLDMAISLSMLNWYLTEECENISYQEGRLLVPGIIF